MTAGFQNDPGVTQQEFGFGFDGAVLEGSPIFRTLRRHSPGAARRARTLLKAMFNRIGRLRARNDSVKLRPLARR